MDDKTIEQGIRHARQYASTEIVTAWPEQRAHDGEAVAIDGYQVIHADSSEGWMHVDEFHQLHRILPPAMMTAPPDIQRLAAEHAVNLDRVVRLDIFITQGRANTLEVLDTVLLQEQLELMKRLDRVLQERLERAMARHHMANTPN